MPITGWSNSPHHRHQEGGTGLEYKGTCQEPYWVLDVYKRQAIYNGAPIVTTSTGAEGIPSGETVLEIEDEAAAFAAKTISLYQDPERLAQMCRRTQEYIREYYSLDGAWNVIKDDFA